MVGKLNEAFTGGMADAASLFEVTCRNISVFQTGIPEYYFERFSSIQIHQA